MMKYSIISVLEFIERPELVFLSSSWNQPKTADMTHLVDGVMWFQSTV